MRALLLVFICAGCVQFNEVCTPDTSEILGDTQRSLDVRATTLTTQEAPVGDFVADALRAATHADIALIPAQSFSPNSDCGPLTFIDRGTLRSDDIANLLPEFDTVVVMSVTSDALARVLEHSVAALDANGQSAQFPDFLQVSGVFFTVDCSQQAQTTSNGAIAFPGQRIDPVSLTVAGVVPQAGQTFHLATTTTLASGAFGYFDLTPSKVLIDTGKTPSAIVEDYVRQHAPIDPVVEGRILLEDTCK